MADRRQIIARASLIEQLLSKRYFEDIAKELTELEIIYVSKEHLQETDIVRAVYRVLKNCPSVTLKKKAKCLLAKWRALYKSTQFKTKENLKLLHSNVNKEESAAISQNVSQDEELGSSQDEISGLCRSLSRLVSQDAAKPAAAIGAESSITDMEINEDYLGGGDSKFTSKSSSALQDPLVSVRSKGIELLYSALASSSTHYTKTHLWQKFAREIEEHIFTLHSNNIKKYKICIRSKVANLNNPKNSHLQQNLLSGTMSAREFAEMTVLDMANQELKQLRASYTESSIQEHHLPQTVEGTQTSKIKCKRCEKYNCKVTVIARGTLFLPGWEQNSNPDEQMTYVICNECGEQWYDSNWVCL
ncbi:transcription elongation factor A N-terminal and central domain-containing protein [Mesocricetus auratus]|uniref:Transcription elongation factor A N-terminal and central domain-containing protein n=1 Tax=Mesocricetus auratus TaxID=10036 RepID=A0A1U7QVX8_MESAU|nr:transcription elongation factor A N-terminal and central domain-containing protein [Mesocricetus auratus]XP_021085222.1 transcription elongation factor A N-terminal and central domain-containing protein [Mesocricetus auratus]XP_040599983.1 transcription elongation factor A N-terminal and central domain-containing protein [Mesocricetus auratus]